MYFRKTECRSQYVRVCNTRRVLADIRHSHVVYHVKADCKASAAVQCARRGGGGDKNCVHLNLGKYIFHRTLISAADFRQGKLLHLLPPLFTLRKYNLLVPLSVQNWPEVGGLHNRVDAFESLLVSKKRCNDVTAAYATIDKVETGKETGRDCGGYIMLALCGPHTISAEAFRLERLERSVITALATYGDEAEFVRRLERHRTNTLQFRANVDVHSIRIYENAFNMTPRYLCNAFTTLRIMH